jgi:hypothetical protein
MQRCPSAPRHIPGRTAPNTSPDTKPAPTVPRAVLQHVSGYETQGKRSPLRANTEPHPRNEIAPVQQKRLTAPQHVPRHIPGHTTAPHRSRHVSGHEPGLNCSSRRAAARGWLRNARKTFPGACWSDGFVPEPLAFTSPGRELELRLRERMAPSTCKIVRRSGFIDKKLR